MVARIPRFAGPPSRCVLRERRAPDSLPKPPSPAEHREAVQSNWTLSAMLRTTDKVLFVRGHRCSVPLRQPSSHGPWLGLPWQRSPRHMSTGAGCSTLPLIWVSPWLVVSYMPCWFAVARGEPSFEPEAGACPLTRASSRPPQAYGLRFPRRFAPRPRLKRNVEAVQKVPIAVRVRRVRALFEENCSNGETTAWRATSWLTAVPVSFPSSSSPSWLLAASSTRSTC